MPDLEGCENILDTIPEVEGVELEKGAKEVEVESAAATLN